MCQTTIIRLYSTPVLFGPTYLNSIYAVINLVLILGLCVIIGAFKADFNFYLVWWPLLDASRIFVSINLRIYYLLQEEIEFANLGNYQILLFCLNIIGILVTLLAVLWIYLLDDRGSAAFRAYFIWACSSIALHIFTTIPNLVISVVNPYRFMGYGRNDNDESLRESLLGMDNARYDDSNMLSATSSPFAVPHYEDPVSLNREDEEKYFDSINRNDTASKARSSSSVTPSKEIDEPPCQNIVIPPEAADDDGAVLLQVQFPNGTRCSRRFSRKASLHSVMNWIRINHSGEFRLVSRYPRRVYTDSDRSLEENGFVNISDDSPKRNSAYRGPNLFVEPT